MSDQPLTPEQAAISHAWQEMFQKSVYFDETIKVLNHWLTNVHGWWIADMGNTWQAAPIDQPATDPIRRETYSQCLAALLDRLSGREEGS